MALMRMSDEEVGQNWHIVRRAIKNSALPTADTGEGKMKNILNSLLRGFSICWYDGRVDAPTTVIITSISEEEISGTKNLLIYCAHAFMRLDSDNYVSMVRTIGQYARGLSCDNVIAYVHNKKLVKLLEKYGAETNYTLAIMPLR